MDDLLRSLRGLGVSAPSPDQLMELLDADISTQRRLAQSLSFELLDPDDPLATGDLLEGAIQAVLENYRRSVDKERSILKHELMALAAPKPIKAVPRKALLARQAADIARQERDLGEAFYQPRQIYAGGKVYCSTAPLGDLKRVEIKDLEAPKWFEGRYLLCRVITRLRLYVGCTFIADDPNGLAIPITISHFTPDLHLRGERLDRLLPIGTVLAIREPFVSLNHLAHGGPSAGKAQVGVRVDTPTDVVLVGEFHPMLRDVAWEGKLESSPVCVAGFEGAVAVTQLWTQEGKAQLAADEEAAQELIKSLLENRRPGAAYRALRAAQRSNSLASPELEARVLYALGQYSRAASVCEGALKSLDATRAPLPHAQLSAQLSRAQSRCDEESKGSFDIRAMYFQSQRVLAPRLDVADFVGRVRVEDVEGAGRGLILTHDVEPGELLLCCKAVGSAYPEDWDGLPVLRLNLETGITTTTSQVLAATNIIHTLIDRPEFAHPFLGLTAGPEMTYSRWVDMPYPLRWTSILREPDRESKDTFEGQHKIDIDAAYVDGVLRFNAFGPSASPAAAQGARNGGGAPAVAGRDPRIPSASGELSKPTMPHPLPAILNHACVPNVSSRFLGDVVTIRALHALPAGTELVHQYVRGEQAYAVRQAELSKHGFVCRCGLCALDRADGTEQLRRRADLLARSLPATMDFSRLTLKRGAEDLEGNQEASDSLHTLLKDIDSTYADARGPLRPELFDLWHQIARHQELFDRHKAIESEIRALRSVGVVLIPAEQLGTTRYAISRLPDLHFDQALRSMLEIGILLLEENGNAAMKWAETAYWAHQCMIEGGVAVFLDRWGGEQEPGSDSVGGQYAPLLDVWVKANGHVVGAGTVNA